VYRKTKKKENVTRLPKMNLIAFILYEIQGECGLDGRFTEGVGWPNLNDFQQIKYGNCEVAARPRYFIRQKMDGKI
jgi:hypothetical protein